MENKIELSEEEFKRLQILFDTEDVLYTMALLHTEEYPTWVLYDHDMQTILSSTKKEGKIMFYLWGCGYNHLKRLKEPFTRIDGILYEFTENKS